MKLRLKIDLVSYPARAEGLVNMVVGEVHVGEDDIGEVVVGQVVGEVVEEVVGGVHVG